MNLFKRIFKRKPKEVECDHIYYPAYDGNGYHYTNITGQECILCGRFNSLEDMGISFEPFKLNLPDNR